MLKAGVAQESACAVNNVFPINGTPGATKRGRPKKIVIPTPAGESFEFYADQTKHIPPDPKIGEPKLQGRRGWLAAKDFARQEAFRDPRLTPTAKNLFSMLLDCVNRGEGVERLHGYGGLARKCGCHVKSIQKAMALLVATGFAVRKERMNADLGWHRVSMTALPTLVRASFVSGEEAEFDFSADTPPPVGGEISAQPRRGPHQTTELTSSSISKEPLSPPEPAQNESSSVSAAFDLWNAFAAEHGFDRCEVQSETRRARMAKRLDEIGGLDRFKLALSQIPADDFLMGKIEPRNGRSPFRLTLDKLLWSKTDMGDLLAQQIETALQAPRSIAPKKKEPDPRPGWWKGNEAAARRGSIEGWEEFVRRWANGHWPVEYLGPLPGTAECLVPEEVVARLNLVERYRDAS